MKNITLFAIVAGLILITGFINSWNTALLILNMGLISAIMALGVNLQWGFAGLFNVGIMGFVALGGLATVLISMAPVEEAWSAGGTRVVLGLVLGAITVGLAAFLFNSMPKGRARTFGVLITLIGGFFLYRAVFDGGVEAVEAVNPAATGYLGGLGLPVLLAWPAGGILAAAAAWVIGKTFGRFFFFSKSWVNLEILTTVYCLIDLRNEEATQKKHARYFTSASKDA